MLNRSVSPRSSQHHPSGSRSSSGIGGDSRSQGRLGFGGLLAGLVPSRGGTDRTEINRTRFSNRPPHSPSWSSRRSPRGTSSIRDGNIRESTAAPRRLFGDTVRAAYNRFSPSIGSTRPRSARSPGEPLPSSSRRRLYSPGHGGDIDSGDWAHLFSAEEDRRVSSRGNSAVGHRDLSGVWGSTEGGHFGGDYDSGVRGTISGVRGAISGVRGAILDVGAQLMARYASEALTMDIPITNRGLKVKQGKCIAIFFDIPKIETPLLTFSWTIYSL